MNRQRTPAMRRVRVGGAAVLLALGALAPIGVRPAPAHAADALTISLVRQQLALSAEAELGIRFRPSVELSDDLRITISVHEQVTDRIQFAAAAAGELRNTVDTLELEPESIRVNDDGTLTLIIPTEAAARTVGALQFPAAGVYPVVVEVRDRTTAATAELQTFVDRLPFTTGVTVDQGTIRVAVIASLTAPPSVGDVQQPLPQSVLDDIAELAEYPANVPISMSVSPELLPRVPEDQIDGLLERLGQASVVSQPLVPFDPSAAAAAGRGETFSKLLVDGEDALAASGAVRRSDRSVWIEADSSTAALTTEGAVLLRSLGVRLLILSPDTYNASANSIGGYTDYSQRLTVQLTDGSLMSAAVLDPSLTTRLDDPAMNVEQRAIWMAADLATWHGNLTTHASPIIGHTVVLGSVGGGVPDPATIARFSEQALATGAVSFSDLDDYEDSTHEQLVDGAVLDVQLQSPPPMDLTARGARLDALTLNATTVASMLVVDDGRRDRWMDALQTLWSTSLDDAAADAGATLIDTELNAITGAVEPKVPSTFTLRGRRTNVPIRIENTSDEELQVLVRLAAGADKLQFPDGDQLAILAPNSIADVTVPVVARTNGTFTVSLDLLTPEGEQPIAATTTLKANVNALTGLAQVLTGGALLVLLTWWVRHLRRGRRTRLASASASGHPTNPSRRAARRARRDHDESIDGPADVQVG